MIIEKLIQKTPAAAARGAFSVRSASIDDQSGRSIADLPDPPRAMQAVIVRILSRTSTNWGLA